MSAKFISFSFHFSQEVSLAGLVVDLLRAGFSDFFLPKIGRIKVDDETLKFGLCPLDQIYKTRSLLAGEEIVSPDLTALTHQPDATEGIVDFLARFPQSSRSAIEFVGDCRLDYAWEGSVIEGWLFRHGDEWSRYPIVFCDVSSSYTPFQWTAVHLSAHRPWFFLKNWWPEGLEPHYSTPETAQRNWDRFVEYAGMIIDVAGADKLDDLYLNLEGSGPCQEEGWLVESARRLPGLQVHMA